MGDQPDGLGAKGKTTDAGGSHLSHEIGSRPQMGRHFKQDDIGIHQPIRQWIDDLQARQILDRCRQPTRAGMIFRQAFHIVVQSVHGGRRQKSGLPHAAAKGLAMSPRRCD
jgi:hypothetical protein